MVVWQPFKVCWRYIIARVSEMHVAYHRDTYSCGISLHRNEPKQTAKKTKSRRPTSLHLTCFIVGGSEKQGNVSVRFLRLSCVCKHHIILEHLFVVIVPQYGRLAAISDLLALYHYACLRNARRIS